MSRREILIDSAGNVCRILGNSDLIDKMSIDAFLYHYIPDGAIVERKKVDVEVLQEEAIRECAEIDYPFCRFRGDLSSRDVITLGEFLLERRRQEANGFYSLSSASASLDGKAVILWGGATNLGKTSSMLSLVEKKGFEFLTDEKTLIDLKNKKVVGGSRSVATRKKVIQDKLNTAENTEFHRLNSNRGGMDIYLLIYPHLDSGLKEPIYYKFQQLDFFWLFYRELSQSIRGTTRLINDFSFPLPSLDTHSISSERARRAKEFCKKIDCYYFQGSTDQFVEFVGRQYKK